MMTLKNLNFFLLMVAASWFTGCSDDLLDQQPIDFLSPDQFSTATDIEQALNGTYKALTGTYSGLWEANSNSWPVYTDFMTDNGFMDKTWSGEVEFWDQSHNPNSLFSNRKWTRNYAGVLRANTVLQYIDQVEMDADLKERYRGEALFLRALYYYDLTEFYGDVPFRTKPDGIESKDASRESKEVIIEQMLTDLDVATEVLPESYSDLASHGRATKGAAMTLKARYYLNNHRYEEAAEACQDVINLSVYDIHSDLYELFTTAVETSNTEVIFDVQFISNAGNDILTSPWQTYFSSFSSYMVLEDLEREFYMANGLHKDDPFSGYDPQNPWSDRDPRLDQSLVLPYTFMGYNKDGSSRGEFEPDAIGSTNFTSLRIKKYVDYQENENGWDHRNSGVNNVLMRYADVLLMRAEGLVMSGTYSESEVAGLINQVRQRTTVNMPTVESVEGTGLSAQELMDIIKHERRVEFAFEGLRIHDIKRWDEGAEAYADGMGYRPNLLTSAAFKLIERSYDSLEAEGVPADVLDDLQTVGNKEFTTESGYLNAIADAVGQTEMETYEEEFKKHSYPSFYETYIFRDRTFNSEKGYLWPIPIGEIVSNEQIGENNPGY